MYSLPRKGNHTRLYEVLEVAPDASEDDIKRSYKKLALKYHPDKNGGVTVDRFKEIGNAYNILIDPQKREIYNTYGEEGLTLYENGVFGEDGELMRILPLLESPVAMCIACMFGFIALSLAFLFPLFIVLKLDGVWNASWGVVFIPLWIDNLIPAIYMCTLPFGQTSKLKSLGSTVQYLCFLAFQILLCVRLDTGSLAWPSVFIPLYIEEAIHFVKRLVQSSPSAYHEAVEGGTVGCLFGMKYFGFIFRKLMVPTLRLVFLGLVVARLDKENWSWWVPAIPIFIGLFWKLVVKVADDYLAIKEIPDGEEQAQNKKVLISMTICMLFSISFVLTFVILIVLQLNGASFSMAIAFIPVWIIFGLAFCCCCCCFPCLICARGGAEDPEAGLNSEQPQENNYNGTSDVTQHKYIEAPPSEPKTETTPLVTEGTTTTTTTTTATNSTPPPSSDLTGLD